MTRLVRGCSMLACLCVCLVSLSCSQNTGPSEAEREKVRERQAAERTRRKRAQESDRLFSEGRYEEAIVVYQARVDEDPKDVSAWFRLGYSLHELGRLDEAIAAHEMAAGFNRFKATATYNWACALAMKGETDAALEKLAEAVDAGFRGQDTIAEDEDLESVRDDPRFAEIIEKVQQRRRQRDAESPYTDFAFWLGKWDVFDPRGKRVGSNEVRSSQNGYVLTEYWRSRSGRTGTSMNFFDPVAKKWKQTWVDETGGIVASEGVFAENKMRLEGEAILPDGERRKRRVTYTPNQDGTVTQHIEQSTDGGQTWELYFEGRYVKQKPKLTIGT